MGGGGLHRNFGPSVTGLAWWFLEIFFDNNVCNRKRSTYLKGFFKTSSKSRNIKLLVNSRYYTLPPFTCNPLNFSSTSALIRSMYHCRLIKSNTTRKEDSWVWPLPQFFPKKSYIISMSTINSFHLAIGFCHTFKLIFLLYRIRVGRSLRCIDQLISQTLGDRLDVPERRLSCPSA